MEHRRNRTISGADQRERVDALIDEGSVTQRPVTGDFETHAGITQRQRVQSRPPTVIRCPQRLVPVPGTFRCSDGDGVWECRERRVNLLK